MKRSLMALAAVSFVVSACNPVVFDSIQEDHANVAVPSTSSGGNVSGTASALSMRAGDVPAGTVFNDDPESLVLFVSSSSPIDCESPVAEPACIDSPTWELVLSIPPELNRVGVIDLADPRIGFHEDLRLSECNGFGSGEGNGFWGTLEITSMDDTSVSFTISGITVTTDMSFDGTYVAERCGTAPITPPPTQVVAKFGSSVSGNPSSGTGTSADPDAIYIFGGTSPGTCEEPVPVVDCTTNRTFMFSLPEELRVPGVINLDDPKIDAVYATPGTSCGTATFHQGTLEITSVDSSHIAFAIAGTEFTGLNGVYEGDVCP